MMMEEPAAPRPARGALLIEATREDLDLYAVGELNERIALLEGEILRARAAIDKKQTGRAAAEALFSSARLERICCDGGVKTWHGGCTSRLIGAPCAVQSCPGHSVGP